MSFNVNEILRYNRHIIMPEIGIDGQYKLKNSKVFVVGAGGLGSPVLLYLSAAGVGNIAICDYDVVSESNLQRQILYSSDEIGKSKVICATKKIKELNPYINVIPIAERIDKDNILHWFKDYDIIIDCSDNFSTRYLVNDACVLLGKPLVYGAIHKFEGQVSVFNYKGGPTYRCLFPEPPTEYDNYDCSYIGVVGALPGIIGALQAIETIKIITGKGKVLSGKLLCIDMFNLIFNIFEINRDPQHSQINSLEVIDETCNSYENVTEITPMEFEKRIETNDISIIDIRERYEFEVFNIGGENIPASIIPTNLDKIKNNSVLICWIGEKSKSAMSFIKQNKPELTLYSLKGGLEAYLKYKYNVK